MKPTLGRFDVIGHYRIGSIIDEIVGPSKQIEVDKDFFVDECIFGFF